MIGLCSLVVFSRTTICCRVRSSAPRTEWCFTRCRDLSFSCRRDAAEPNRCLLIRVPGGYDLVSRLVSWTRSVASIFRERWLLCSSRRGGLGSVWKFARRACMASLVAWCFSLRRDPCLSRWRTVSRPCCTFSQGGLHKLADSGAGAGRRPPQAQKAEDSSRHHVVACMHCVNCCQMR